jgi:hypothetical protein
VTLPPDLAATAARTARQMLGDAEPLSALWRHVVLQTIDAYESVRRLHGVEQAAAGFDLEPELTGDDRVDAALAALAEYLARRDGWRVPGWARQEGRSTLDWWFIDDLPALQAFALRESPLSFRKRGVFIGDGGLQRV